MIRHGIRTLTFCLLGFSSLNAEIGYSGIFDMGAGYRHDKFDWSVQDPYGFPNDLAELNHKDIHIVQAMGRGILAGYDTIYAKVEGAYGWVVQEEAIYSVYSGNDRRDLFSQAVSQCSGNTTYDLKGALGVHIVRNPKTVDVGLYAGFGANGQSFRFNNPLQTVFEGTIAPDVITPTGLTSALGVLDPLSSKQKNVWLGGYGGMDVLFRPTPCVTIRAEYELHYSRYRAKGNWELDSTFREAYHDKAYGWGQVASATVTYLAGDCWYIGVWGGFQFWKTNPGVRIVNQESLLNTVPEAFTYIGTLPTADSILNPVKWCSYFVTFTLECQF